MPNREIHNILHFVPLFEPKAAVTDNTPIVSSIIDLANYNAAEFAFVTGTDADSDATFAVTFEHGDDSALSDTAAPAAGLLVGTAALAGYDFAADYKARKVGYIGTKRYFRMTITPSANTGNVFVGGMAVLGFPSVAPTPTQA